MLEINNTTRQKINRRQITSIVEKFLQSRKKSGWEVSLAIIGTAKMKRLNLEYRGLDRTTDVLSFSGGGPAAKKYLGEIIINIQETGKIGKYREMLEEIGVSKANSNYILNFLIVHGLLHLVGYNDETDRERLGMLRLGRDFLKRF